MIEFMKKKKWLIACSGGPDSMALVHMCDRKGLSFSVAMVNYHVRIEAEEEEEYVRAWCEEHQIVFHVKDDPFEWQGNFEAAARTYRYDFFVKLVQKYDYAGVMTAHHKDDVIETWLMQKERGITPSCYGLARVSLYQDMRIYRPLLTYDKKALVQYCQDNAIRYYIDQTNLNGENARSRLRQSVHYSEAEKEQILADIARENDHLKDIRKKADSLIDADGIVCSAYRQAEEEVRLCAVRRYIDKEDQRHLSAKYMQELDHIFQKKDFLTEDNGMWLVTDGKHIWKETPVQPYKDLYPEIEERETDCYAVKKTGRSTEAVTVRPEDYPLTIRNVREGDAIAMFYGTKKVHRFFIDRHIPLYQRKRWPVVVNREGRIILVPELGCDRDHYSQRPTFFVQVRKQKHVMK